MATTLGNAAKRLPESEVTDEPSMEEILSSIKQIIADDEQNDGTPENREDFTYPENPSNSNRSDTLADDQQLSEALQAELNEVAIDNNKSAAVSTSPVQNAGTGSKAQPRENLETRVAAVRAELSSTSEALSPEERLQHYRSRNKMKDEGRAVPAPTSPTSNDARTARPIAPVRSATNRPAPVAVQQPVAMAPTQFIASPPPETVAQELATIMLREKSGELETMLADLMRPTIRQWLNDNLPSMVQRLVREEIRAASRGHKTS